MDLGDKGHKIYWLEGAQAADDYEDFYDGSWDAKEGKDQGGVSTGRKRFGPAPMPTA